MPKQRKKPRLQRGHQLDSGIATRLTPLLAGLSHTRDNLLPALHRIQDQLGHLPSAWLVALADALRLAPAEVYEVASFYHHFELVDDGTPKPPITVRVCESLTCRQHGAAQLLTALQAASGEQFRVQRVPCVGRCIAPPLAVVGQNPIEQASVEQVLAAVANNAIDAGMPPAQNLQDYRAAGGYGSLQAFARGVFTANELIDTLARAGLRGLGGAGFPAHQKWQLVRAQPAPRVLVVNIDEGEPGTCKDRHILETQPHVALEGALIAARAIGAADITIYLRDEYAGCRQLLQRELAALRAVPPLAGGLPRIHLRRGAGSYVCGEESALIESLEGRRGMPRLRPPYPAEHGLFGRPTLGHNLETLYWVARILAHGPRWYRNSGRRGHAGLRLFSLSGRIARPGVYAAPAGITVRELIDQHGGGMLPGHQLYAWLPGGAAGGILPASLADTPLDFGSLDQFGCFIGSAAVVVLSQQDSARDAALNAMRFFAAESCGKCTPCRVGTAKAVELMQAPRWDRALMQELSTVMQDASICGLGQAAPNPMLSVLRYFPQELDDD